jgi:hypothetical protein
VDVHLTSVGMVSNGSLLLPATSYIIRNTKTNKIIAGTNLRFLGIFFSFFIYITDRIQFDQFIVYKIVK